MAVDLSTNVRSRLAHASAPLTTKAVRTTLYTVTVLFAVMGCVLLAVGQGTGWLVLSVAALPWALVVWVQRYLQDIPPSAGSQEMGSLLESSLLRRLPLQPSPRDLAQSLHGSGGGRFFMARLNISAAQLVQISSTDTTETPAVWQAALDLQARLGGDTVSSATLAAALLLHSPYTGDFLAQLSLDTEDVVAGAQWYRQIQTVIVESRKPKKTGGLARDWAFGYTPLLERFGVNISAHISSGSLPHVRLESHQDILQQLARSLSSGTRRNAALVGPLGVGKMAIIHSLAEKLLFDPLVRPEIRYHQVVLLDASSLIGAAPGRGELERLVNSVLLEAHRAKNVILCLDNAQLFFEDSTGSVDLSNVLLPVLEGGALRIVLTMDDQRWLQISQRLPQLATAINRITVMPPSREETLSILETHVLGLEHHHKMLVTYPALKATYELADRYIQEQAMPGKAIKLLEAALGGTEEQLVTATVIQRAVEQMTGIKVGTAEATEERQTLLNMEQLIHARMINQERAVQAVSDALRRARSGVRNPNRPIGTFLFMGPTGVGKTELSKALAAVYFGGEEHLVRIDMNEYLRSADLPRLIADAASNEHSLAAQVGRNPFSVVLLDEIEKAHPDIILTLLQVLDEGVMRDVNGRTVSFRDTIIIATSNAGAQRIYEYVRSGQPLPEFEKQLQDELIAEGTFKPEFLNRFDEVVLFTPLGKPELRQVADLMLASVNRTLDGQKVSVLLQDEAKELLIDSGYDPQFGARPMRRAVQRTVENVVARRVLEGSVRPGQVVEITADDIRTNLEQR
jgi:ATP-dependent Clp protease ATP-binding subunit ClpC